MRKGDKKEYKISGKDVIMEEILIFMKKEICVKIEIPEYNCLQMFPNGNGGEYKKRTRKEERTFETDEN